ncbi:galactose-1-phosphate uridylyltransferase [Rubrivivax gelatinosus]|uniref:Galactose-1-phosphate uridylyltransferase n=1 Tax=Rubrivivax gelatinosus TaxID=28068 RepID=A0ABS1DTP6_RUBGE|nr:galactose-1-phosphate uridylyltransferase [Rubrivivax gelatinosus]MBK1713096.1 galactose-1-phosphate uridylyltransferase [Rubrivivax gelatinosus]
MQALDLLKPDGRRLTLYGHHAPTPPASVPSPFADPLAAAAHLRWHPLRGEWISYAAFRQDRTFLPPPEYNPLAPTRDPAAPTELPAGDWEIAVFENRFPSLGGPLQPPPAAIVETAPAQGACEVVVFTQDPATALGALPLARLELLLEVWGDRSTRLAARGDIAWVLPFENRGSEVGVTLHHPHGQIYAYPTLPPLPARLDEHASRHHAATGRTALQDLIAAERGEGNRMLYAGEHAVAFVPVCARYPYECWVAPIAPVADFAALSGPVRADLARALKTTLLKLDGLWQRPMPYLMAWYQAPCDGRPQAPWHLHAEIWPAYRSRERLKYLAGTELAAGWFAMDALPEATAAELQRVEVLLT